MKFDKAEVVDFDPRPHSGTLEKAYFFWPSLAYRVTAPKVTPNESNLFEVAIMKLLRAGITETERIGDLLSIHSQLVLHILVDLHQRGFLDELYTGLTEKAVNELDGEVTKNTEMVTGYVFQDPWGEVWPAFRTSLDLSDIKNRDRLGINLISEKSTIGAPESFWTEAIYPKGVDTPSLPSASDILKAIIDASRRGDKLGISITPDEIRKVEYLDETPTPVFIKTIIYFEKSNRLDWFVCDLFGRGESLDLRIKINQVKDENKQLFNFIKKFESKFEELHWEKSKVGRQEFKDMLAEKAKKEVVRKMTKDISNYNFVFQELVEMEKAWLDETDAPSEDGRGFKYVYIRSRCAFEEMLKSWENDFPLKGLIDRLGVETLI